VAKADLNQADPFDQVLMYHGSHMANQIAIADWGFIHAFPARGCWFSNLRCVLELTSSTQTCVSQDPKNPFLERLKLWLINE
jgi:hypothetical protein